MFGLFRPSSAPRLPGRSPPAVEPLEERSVPAVFTVTNRSDHNPGSLRQAVLRANANPGADTIRFAPAFDATITLTTGEIDITGNLTIEGLGADRCVVSGNNASRIFDLDDAPPSVNVEISGLKLTRGVADDAVNGTNGGAIRAADADLTLRDCVVSGNRAADDGGAVQASGGSVIAVDTIFANNRAGSDAGALYLGNTRFHATNCQIRNNNAAVDGGGFYGFGVATLRGCTISGNTAGEEGGGLEWSGSRIVIERTTIRNNTSFYGGGASFDGYTSVTIRDSTIAFNRTNGDGDEGGAGFMLEDCEALIVQCTVSGNVDQTSNPDSDTGGGGIRIQGGNTVIRNSTIAFNSTTGRGGGIFLDQGARLQLASTIVSNSSAPGGNFDVARPAGDGNVSAVFSLIQRIEPGFINNGSTGNILGANPLLLPLADNGGPTFTHAFTVGSPVVNAGSNPEPVQFDQRGPGFPRVKNGKVDIGALELF